MSAIPPNPVTMDDLVQWSEMTQQMNKLKAAEMLLRKKIFAGLFPNPKEGANSHPLSNGYRLTATHVITRKLDEPMLNEMLPELAAAHISVPTLVKYKPEFVLSGYRELTAEQQQLFDRVLTISDGSPQLKIVPPAKSKGAQ